MLLEFKVKIVSFRFTGLKIKNSYGSDAVT